MGGNGRHNYSWYKHHAWAALAMISLFFAVTRFVSVSKPASIAIVCVLGTYALVALGYTYRHNEDNMAQGSAAAHDDDKAKAREKLEKKRIKTEAKIRKKT